MSGVLEFAVAGQSDQRVSAATPLPVSSVSASGNAQAVNTDGSTVIAGSNGTARSTASNPLNAAINGVTAGAIASATNPVATADTPNVLASSAPLSSQTTVAAGSLIAKAAAGNCYGFNVVSGASAGYFMLFNSATVPADGAVTPFKTYVMAANTSLGVHWDVPRRFSTGIVGVFSTTGPFTKTISATAFIGIDYV